MNRSATAPNKCVSGRDNAIVLGADGLGQVDALAEALRRYGFRQVIALVDDPEKYTTGDPSWFQTHRLDPQLGTSPRSLRTTLLRYGMGPEVPVVCAYDGLTIPYVQAIRELLPEYQWTVPWEAILRARSKPHTRLALKRTTNCPMPWRVFSSDTGRQAAWDAAAQIELADDVPYFVKPCTGFQSTFVTRAASRSEANSATRAVRAAIAGKPLWKMQPVLELDDLTLDPAVDVLVEGELQGPEYTVDGIVVGNEVHCVAQHKEVTYSAPFHGDGVVYAPPDPIRSSLDCLPNHVAGGVKHLSAHGGRSAQGFREFIRDVLRAIGLDNWVFHAELVDTDQGLRLIELNPRLPGGLLALSAGQHLGVDFADSFVRFVLGIPVAIAKTIVTAHVPFYADTLGRVSHVEGLEEARAHPSVVRAVATIQPGTEITTRERENYAGFVVFRGFTHAEVREAVSEVMPSIRVAYS